MLDKFPQMSAELYRYAVEHSDGRDELMRRLAEETEEKAGGSAEMLTSPEQAALMTLLVRAIGARRALELGTFTGYGSISIARGLPADGTLISCDVSDEWTGIARRYFDESGLADRIDLQLGPALDTLAKLHEDEPFDFAFIDADKVTYPEYYEECLRLLRPGGLVMLDNMFQSGEVIDEAADRESVRAIRELNDRIAADERVLSVMLGIADGVTLALKNG